MYIFSEISVKHGLDKLPLAHVIFQQLFAPNTEGPDSELKVLSFIDVILVIYDASTDGLTEGTL